MNIVKLIGDFFLSLWIWQITYDLFHPLITALAMFLILRFVMRRKRIRSLIIAFGSQLVALAVLTAIVPAFLISVVGWQYTPLDIPQALSMAQMFMPSLWLGVFYAVVQALLFCIGRFFCYYPLTSYLTLIVVSNGIGVILSYLLIRTIEFAYYVG